MNLTEITDQNTWEDFVSTRPMASFLQSWAWGEFQQKLGHKVLRLGLLEQDKIIASVLVIISTSRLAKMAYTPHGPLLDWNNSEVTQKVFADLKSLAKDEQVDYLRIDPRFADSSENKTILTKLGLKKAPIYVQAEVEWLLDISNNKNDDQLLAEMRETTRYLIKKAPKMGAKVVETSDPRQMTVFHELMSQTANRQGFTPHRQSYLQTQFDVLSRAGIAKLFIASYQENDKTTPLAAGVLMFYGDNSSYVHGATSLTTKIPGAYLMQWEAIKLARKNGLKIYNFWGIAPTESKSHPWYGLSLFKKGFGGYRSDLIGAWDLPLTSKYQLIRLIETYHRFKWRV